MPQEKKHVHVYSWQVAKGTMPPHVAAVVVALTSPSATSTGKLELRMFWSWGRDRRLSSQLLVDTQTGWSLSAAVFRYI